LAIVPIGPQMMPACRFDQLRGNAYPAGSPPHAAFEHITHPKLTAHSADIDCWPLIRERRAPRDHKKRMVARKISDDVLGDAFREIFLLSIAAHIREREHRDRRLLRQWSRRCRNTGRRAIWFIGVEIEQDSVRAHWPSDVLDLLLAH